jgi:hypothetical protein
MKHLKKSTLKPLVIILFLCTMFVRNANAQCNPITCPNEGSNFTITAATCDGGGSVTGTYSGVDNSLKITKSAICCPAGPETCPKSKLTFCYHGLEKNCSYTVCYVRIDNIENYGDNIKVLAVKDPGSGLLDYTPVNNYLNTHGFTKICQTITADANGDVCGEVCLPPFGVWNSILHLGNELQSYEYYTGDHDLNDRIQLNSCHKIHSGYYNADIQHRPEYPELEGILFHGSLVRFATSPYYNPPPGQPCPPNLCSCD